MKDKIYTISISEAFEKGGVCPFCTIEKKLESELIDLTLGGAMMEPDIRERTNEQGFCSHHFDMLKDAQKVLPLSLIVQSHIHEKVMKLYKMNHESKKSLLGKEKTDYKKTLTAMSEAMQAQHCSCYLCSRIESSSEKCLDTAIYMWKNEKDFRKTMRDSDGFCIKHSSMLLKYAAQKLSSADQKEFLTDFVNLQDERLADIYADLTAFVDSFDYRNNEPLTEKVKNSLSTAIKMV